jgi:hypothetical protein
MRLVIRVFGSELLAIITNEDVKDEPEHLSIGFAAGELAYDQT